jgi:hypothetical protein
MSRLREMSPLQRAGFCTALVMMATSVLLMTWSIAGEVGLTIAALVIVLFAVMAMLAADEWKYHHKLGPYSDAGERKARRLLDQEYLDRAVTHHQQMMKQAHLEIKKAAERRAAEKQQAPRPKFKPLTIRIPEPEDQDG